MSDSRTGSLYHRITDSGLEITLYPMIGTNVRIVVGQAGAMQYDRGWCVHVRFFVDVLLFLDQWDGEGVPDVPWHRDISTHVRREIDNEGRVVREWVAT